MNLVAPTPPPASPPPLTPEVRALLAGLASIHDSVLALDVSGRVRWLRVGPALAGDGGEALAQADDGALNEGLAGWLSGSGDESAAAEWARLLGRSAGVAGDESCRASLLGRSARFEVECFDTAQTDGAPGLRIAVIDPESAGAATSIDALSRKNQELETTVRSVAHDLRSPLVSVLGFTRLLRDDFGDSIGRTGLHFVDRIEQAGRNMQRLLDDMLELSRMDETPHCPVHVSPLAVLEQLAAELKIPLDEADITLRLPVDPPVVVCDRTRLYQLFSNLIGNAIRHMDRAEGGTIEVSVESEVDGYRLVVADNGPGIGAKDRERIFDAFQTGDRPAGRRGAGGASHPRSSGLGLAIVRRIVETHRGRVHVESEPGQGARFVVWLPRTTA